MTLLAPDRFTALCIVLLSSRLACAEPAAGQEEVSEEPPGPKTFCLSSGPRDDCVSFLLAEAGVSTRLTPSASDAPPVQPSWELGTMVNVPGRHAVGAALFFRGLDADESRAGLRIRYRHRTRGNLMFEAGGGVIFESNDTGASGPLTESGILGPAVLLRASYRDLVGVSLEYESVDVRGRWRESDVFATVRSGSKLGGVLVGALAVFAIIGVIVVSAG